MIKKILFTLLLIIFMIPGVYADSVIELSSTNKEIYENAIISTISYDTDYSCSDYDSCYQKGLDLFKESGNDYYYIRLSFSYSSSLSWIAYMYLQTFDFSSSDTYTASIQGSPSRLYFTINDVNYLVNQATTGSQSTKQSFYELYDTNFTFISSSDITFSNFYKDGSNITIKSGEFYPLLKDLVQYDNFDDYKLDFNNYKEVNLDDYEFVILSLRDYSKTEDFETKFQVKGMVGITPVYEFGTIEKDVVTDRCNISYSEFTDYRFFVLKNDLINNAVYYVKSCEENSVIKFDSTIFNIHYVTADTVNDPVITVGGNTYHVIPFNQLSTTANSNEENNFVPGASEQFEIGKYLSSFWNSLTTLMGLVTKFFNTLPIEIRAISITAFFTAITLGVIKFIKS